jgi:hypothetical protein
MRVQWRPPSAPEGTQEDDIGMPFPRHCEDTHLVVSQSIHLYGPAPDTSRGGFGSCHTEINQLDLPLLRLPAGTRDTIYNYPIDYATLRIMHRTNL